MNEKFIKLKYKIGESEYLRFVKLYSINAIIQENNKLFFVDSEVAGNEILMKDYELIDYLDKNNLLSNFIICEPKELIKLKGVKNKTREVKHTFDNNVKVFINKDSIHSIHIAGSGIDAFMMLNIFSHSKNDELIFTFEDKVYAFDKFISENNLAFE